MSKKAMIFNINPQSPEVTELLRLIEDKAGVLSKYLRTIHDFAIHFSEIDIDNEMKGKLYCLAELSRIIEEIETTSPNK